MKFRRVFKIKRLFVYVLCVILVFFGLKIIYEPRRDCIPDNSLNHKMYDMKYMNKRNITARTGIPISFEKMNQTVHKRNETLPGMNVTSRNLINDIRNYQKENVNIKHDVLKTPKITPKPIRRTRTFTVSEFMLKAEQDTEFLNRILRGSFLHRKTKQVLKRYFTGSGFSFEPEFKAVFKDRIRKDFDIANDVMVFLHIQKTGGTHLNDRLAKELKIPFKCHCDMKQIVCPCLNPQGNVWIYSSKFSGWPCGLHADWTQLHRCMPGQIDLVEKKTRRRRYFYFTQLRDPISRYLSEYYHQSIQGGHWQDALLGCGPGFSDWADVRPCFLTESWKGVSLDDFMSCQYNLATNRMTRMLADLTKSDCYSNFQNYNSRLKRASLWVESAKGNLQQMEYFGLMEQRDSSDKLFSDTFRMQFKGSKSSLGSHSSRIRITEEQFIKIVKLVELDIHIYLFAKDLFESRLRNLN